MPTSPRDPRPFSLQRRIFPDPQSSLHGGIVAISDTVDSELLIEAYSFGIFPWPQEDSPILWFSPDPRGVILFEDFRMPTRFKKFYKKHPFQTTWNKAFAQVIDGCQKTLRPAQAGTWITPVMREAYLDFHRQGYAHSLEVWRNDQLVGGLYGVFVAGVFCGESMFYREDDASKVALVKVVEELKRQGHTWMDVQMVTPVTEAFGAKMIKQDIFLRRLEKEKTNFRPFLIPQN